MRHRSERRRRSRLLPRAPADVFPGENPQDKERNVFGEGLRIDGDVSSDTDIVIRCIVHGTSYAGETSS